jgi:hypothetical protein
LTVAQEKASLVEERVDNKPATKDSELDSARHFASSPSSSLSAAVADSKAVPAVSSAASPSSSSSSVLDMKSDSKTPSSDQPALQPLRMKQALPHHLPKLEHKLGEIKNSLGEGVRIYMSLRFCTFLFTSLGFESTMGFIRETVRYDKYQEMKYYVFYTFVS